MFNNNDYTRFSLTIYDLEGMPINGVYEIPDNIDLKFELPINTCSVVINEYGINNNSHYRSSNILKIYLGSSETVLLKNTLGNHEIIFDDSLVDLRKDNIEQRRALIDYLDGKKIYKKFLKDNEITMGSIEEIEKYIRQLSCQIGSLQNQTRRIKKLLKQQ